MAYHKEHCCEPGLTITINVLSVGLALEPLLLPDVGIRLTQSLYYIHPINF